QARGIAFVIRHGAPDEVAVTLAKRAALVVCDRGYLRPQKQWRARVAAEAKRRVIQVEGDIVVPVDLVSTMRETGARTLRPKLSRLREDFLHPLASEQPGMSADRLDIRSDVDLSDVPALIAQLRID